MHSLAEKTLWTVFANDMPMVTFYVHSDAQKLAKKLNEVADRLRDVKARRPIHWNIQSSQTFGVLREEIKMSRFEMDHMFQFCFKKANYDQYQHILDERASNAHSDWGLM